ncbi:unnamed protein product, partial [Mesorhabditis spiculigera]
MADDLPALDLGKKKKAKKPLKLDDEPAEGAAAPADVAAATDDIGDLQLGKKKSKKKDKALAEEVPGAADGADSTIASGIGRDNLIDAKGAWPDYSYQDMLTLVFNVMREKNPDMAGEKKKFAMKPPEVQRAGSKKTAFSNFTEICRVLKRDNKHVLQFLLAELGTTGSIDGNNCLILKGKFLQKHLESVLRKYIKEYVMCHTCKSSDTALVRETRLFFLQCHSCNSRCSVTAIRAGFTAMVGKRAAIRRAQEATGQPMK